LIPAADALTLPRATAVHASTLENIARCRDRYLTFAFFARRVRTRILCAGVTDGPGSCRPLFSFPGARYLAADVRSGDGVDVVLNDPHAMPFAAGGFHVIVGGQLLGRCDSFSRHFVEMVRLLHTRGLLFVVAPSAGPGPRSTDEGQCLSPQALDDLARLAGVFLIDRWVDRRGPSRELVGVFAKRPIPARRQSPAARRSLRLARAARPTLTPGGPPPRGIAAAWARRAAKAPAKNAQTSAAEEAGRPGRERYTVVLEALHRALEPRLYVEVGVRHGRSLRLARGRAVGIDPASRVRYPLPPHCTVVPTTSDEFFETAAPPLIDTPVDLAFIDGLHLFEYALRDFMNLERLMAPAGIIVCDDVFPDHPAQAERLGRTGIWMGDVWKIACILREYRPELACIPVDVATGGLLIVAGLAPRSDVLWDRYNEIVERFSAPPFDQVPRDVLTRTGSVDPRDARFRLLLARLRELRDGDADSTLARAVIASVFARPSASQLPSNGPSGRMS
jgi:SAM-dependent methyltransferase